MKLKYCFALVLGLAAFCLKAQVSVQNLLCENKPNPIGIGSASPRFSWYLISDKRGARQTGYEIKVSNVADGFGKKENLVWESGKVMSDSSFLVCYRGKPLQSDVRYFWQVKVYDENGKASPWSATAFFQTALFSPSDWKAKWIGPGYNEDTTMRPSPLLRKEFTATKAIKQATAYITAHGLYEANLNGKRIGDAQLAPGWTSYHKNLAYQCYDVTSLINKGPNALGVTLANGWWRGIVAWKGKNFYGSNSGLLLQVNLHYTDGTAETIISDGTWKTSDNGPIRYAELQRGEQFDARLDNPQWKQPGFNAGTWTNAREQPPVQVNLFPSNNEPIRRHENFKPVKVLKSRIGETILDFGQNLVGWVQVKAKGKPGDKIALSHAEVLDKKGNFYIENLRAAKAEDTWFLKGAGETEVLEPHFTFHGFRYVRVDAYPGEIKPENFTAIALYSDMPEAGSFSCSDSLINKLQSNIQWGQKGNFLDVPTDCPQRDERLGWTGDAQVFFRTAAYNRNVANFFDKWLMDLSADQFDNGIVPVIIPDMKINGASPNGRAGWSDVATIIPADFYQAYGDKRLLDRQYSSMKKWVAYIQAESKNDLWNSGEQYGDWLSYDADNDVDGRSAVTDDYLVAQCFYANSVQIIVEAAKVLGKPDDVATYSALLKRVKEAFNREYVTPNGALISNTQTAYVLALNFDMLPEKLRQQAAARLAANVESYKFHLTTGFLGTPYICQVLSRFGYTDVAYKLLFQKTYPSWLYPVTKGATTIWERWNSIKPDSSFSNRSMNSFNHYAYGAIGDWLYRNVAGLSQDQPAYKHLLIKPEVGTGLTAASASLLTPLGKAASKWDFKDGTFNLNVTIPHGATASVYIQASSPELVTESGKAVSKQSGVASANREGNFVKIEIGSGTYRFSTRRQ